MGCASLITTTPEKTEKNLAKRNLSRKKKKFFRAGQREKNLDTGVFLAPLERTRGEGVAAISGKGIVMCEGEKAGEVRQDPGFDREGKGR